MAESWEVIKDAVEKVISDRKLKVTDAQREAFKVFADYGITTGNAAKAEKDFSLAKGSAKLYTEIINIIANGDEEVEEDNNSSLWDSIAKTLADTQPEDSEYIVIKRQ